MQFIKSLSTRQRIYLLITLFILFALIASIYLVQRKQDIRKQAATSETGTSTSELPPGELIPISNNKVVSSIEAQSLLNESTAFRDWQKISLSNPPSGRYRSALAFFQPRETLVLFGGWGGWNVGQFNDTWEFDGNSWTLLDNVGTPGPIHGHQMVYDEARERIVLFGGIRCTVSLNCWDINDTYQFADQPAWMRINTANSPTARQGHAMAYDSQRDRILIFGGASGSTFLNDTWEFDGNDWREIDTQSAPSARFIPNMSYDSQRGKIVLHGGYNQIEYNLNDTWEYDSSTETWKEITPNQKANSNGGGAMAYNQKNDRTVIFGGNSPGLWSSEIIDETWEYNGTTWQEMYPENRPLPLRYAMMTYFPKIQKLVLFGGSYWDQPNIRWLFLNDTWTYITQEPVLPTSTPTPAEPILCPTDCPTSLQITPNKRADGKYNIQLSWNDVEGEGIFRIFRNGERVFQLKENMTSWIDTNSGNGFNLGTELSYEVRPLKANCSFFTCSPISVVWSLSNGSACSSDNQCSSGICGTDSDNDGYFDLSLGHTGICQASAKPYTDCYDKNAKANPGDSIYYGAHRGDGSYDYNCDGVEERYPDWDCSTNLGLPACRVNRPGGRPGFVGSPPSVCGQAATYREMTNHSENRCTDNSKTGSVIRCNQRASYDASSWKIYERTRWFPCR